MCVCGCVCVCVSPHAVVEIFGSPFMRNCSAIIGLMLGYIVAVSDTHTHTHTHKCSPSTVAPVHVATSVGHHSDTRVCVCRFPQAAINVDGNRFVTSTPFENAPGVTFIWTTTFPLSFYAPAIIPLIICVSAWPTHAHDHAKHWPALLWQSRAAEFFKTQVLTVSWHAQTKRDRMSGLACVLSCRL